MISRRMIIGVCAALLLAGVIGLLTPVSVSGGGGRIGCGNAVAADESAATRETDKGAARMASPHQFVLRTDYGVLCESSVMNRRIWTVPLALLGTVGVAGAVWAARRQRALVD